MAGIVRGAPVMRDRAALVAAVLGPLVGCALLALFRDRLPNTDAALLLVLVVVAVAANGNRPAGYVAALSSAVWFDFFLTQPYLRFTIDRRADLRTTALLLLVGVAVTEIAVWGRNQQALASRQAGYLAGMREATETVSTGGSGTKLVQDVSHELVRILGLTDCRFEYGTAGVGQPARLRRDGEVEWKREVWDVPHRGLPVDVDIELLVESAGRLKGRYLMRAALERHPTLSQRLVAVTLAGQVGAGLG
jgi:K+-sensing histidine kinase KdpD